MPIYEYRCTACKHEHEAIRKFSDAPLVTCPKCGKETLTKLLSAAGFHLKGSGWYQTDFRGGSKPAAKSDGDDSKSGDTAKAESSGTGDTKPSAADAKADTKADPKPTPKLDTKAAAKSDKPAGSGSGSSAAV